MGIETMAFWQGWRNRLSRALLLGIVSMLAASAGPVLANAMIWNFSVCNGNTAQGGTSAGTVTGGGAVGNSYACAANGSATRNLAVTAWGAVSAGNNTFDMAFVSNQGIDGFGVGAQSEGGASVAGTNGALDNDPTTLAPNLILLTFSSAVILDKVTLGWSLNDADLTIIAYTGALPPSSFIGGKTSANLTSGGAGSGWSLIENAGDAAPDATYGASSTAITYDINRAGVSSSYWLISAYDSNFGGGALDTLVDYASLLSVTTSDAASVLEPGSLALLGLGLASLGFSRRRQ